MSFGNNCSVHALRHIILVRRMGYGVVPDNAFLSAERLKIRRTKFHTIIGSQDFQLPLSASQP
jgi:hypothetical protein